MLRHLPVYDSLRVPSRFLIVLVFHLASLGAIALDAAAAPRVPPRVRPWLGAASIALVGLLVIDLAIVTRPSVDNWWNPPIDAAVREAAFRLVPVPDYDAVYASFPRQHRGTERCYIGGMEWRVAPGLWWNLPRFARLEAGDGRVDASDRTNQTLRARVTLSTPSRLVFDQNFDPDFVTNVGRAIDDEGRLALDLPAGRHDVIVRYAPWYFVPSLFASLLGLALGAFLAFRPRGPRS